MKRFGPRERPRNPIDHGCDPGDQSVAVACRTAQHAAARDAQKVAGAIAAGHRRRAQTPIAHLKQEPKCVQRRQSEHRRGGGGGRDRAAEREGAR